MQLTKIRAVGLSTVDFPLELADPDGPYVLKGVDGLNPVAVDILANGDRRPQPRQIVLLVGLQPAYYTGQTAEQLRTELYGLLTPKGKSLMNLQMMNGSTVLAYVVGQVTKMEVGLFSQDPEVQITVNCVPPTESYLLAPAVVVSAPPIPNPVDGLVTVSVNNPGTAPSGFRIGMQFTSPVAADVGVLISDDQPGGQWMRVNRAFATGDRVIIDTRPWPYRGIWSVNAGAGIGSAVARINEFDADSDWMTFFRGVNNLIINQQFTWYDNGIQYTPAYWGV